MIKQNFEKYFYIPEDPRHDSEFIIEAQHVHQRGIYKDTHNATSRYRDFQLRPNFAVALVVAPDLVDETRAKKAIQKALELLSGPLGRFRSLLFTSTKVDYVGMKTLDPIDWEYRGDYDNDNNSSDPLISRGYNYHQGPEWVWIYEYFMRAVIKFKVDPSIVSD